MLPGVAEYYPDPHVATECDTAQVDIRYVISKEPFHSVRYAGVASAEVALVLWRPAAAPTEPIECRR
jgi:hypothetical protein